MSPKIRMAKTKIRIVKKPTQSYKGKYPFTIIKVGQGFEVDDAEMIHSVRSQASKHNKLGEKQFTVQRTEKGILVLRLK